MSGNGMRVLVVLLVWGIASLRWWDSIYGFFFLVLFRTFHMALEGALQALERCRS